MGLYNINSDKNIFSRIPKPALYFLIRAFFLYLIWVCVYHFYLGPKQIIDPPLTYSVTFITSKIAHVLYPGQPVTVLHQTMGYVIQMGKRLELEILDGCNALELYVFYIGFILCYSGPAKILIKFIVAGVLGIFILNIARCVALFYLGHIHYKYIDSVHHYVFTIVVYSFILLLWFNFFKISLKAAN